MDIFDHGACLGRDWMLRDIGVGHETPLAGVGVHPGAGGERGVGAGVGGSGGGG